MTGLFHASFESSHFAPGKGYGPDKALWLGGNSTFANPKMVKSQNHKFITVEGIFLAGPGGHMGLWAGELQRITSIVRVKYR